MRSVEEKIAWVLEFCQADIAAFRPGDWLNFTTDLQEFLGKSVSLNSRTSREQLQKMQQEVRQYLEGVSQHLRQMPPDAKWALTVPATDIFKISFRGFSPDRWEVQVQTESLSTAFFFSLGLTLTGIDTDRIRSCLECTRLFFADHGRKRFCSATCKQRDASQRFRERHGEELRVKAHTRYEKKKRAKHGPRVIVGYFRKTRTAKEEG
jgi:hypothetical protein